MAEESGEDSDEGYVLQMQEEQPALNPDDDDVEMNEDYWTIYEDSVKFVTLIKQVSCSEF